MFIRFFVYLSVSIGLLGFGLSPALAVNSHSIQLAPIANHLITDESVDINVKVSLNLAIEFNALTPLTCSVSNKTIRLKNLGLCTISAKPITGGNVDSHTAYQSFYINSAIAAGYFHSLRINANGNLYAWGNNSNGQLGDGTQEQKSSPTLVNLPAGVKAVAVATGNSHSLAIGSDGKLYAWGNNNFGQLGDGTIIDKSTPVLVNLPEDVELMSIAAGAYHSIAIDKNGILYAWGSNADGQLGIGSNVNQATPVAFTLPNRAFPLSISAGQLHSLAIGSDSRLYAWGGNHHGQLGYGSKLSLNKPMAVKLASNAYPIMISAGANHSLTLTGNGDIYAWGSNFAGQLGDNSELDRTYPVRVDVPFGVNITSISAGANHNTAISESGELYAWGFNMFGQLGDGSKTNRNIPTKIDATGTIGSASVSVAGAMHSMMLNRESKVFSWGGNRLGQLGIAPAY